MTEGVLSRVMGRTELFQDRRGRLTTAAPSPVDLNSPRWLITEPYADLNYLQPPQGAAQVGSQGALQLGSTGAQQVTSWQASPQASPHLSPQPPSFGSLNFGIRILGSLNQLFFFVWQEPQPSPQASVQAAGAQQAGSTGAQEAGSTGAQQFGSTTLWSPQAAGATQLGSTGAQQLGSQALSSPQAAGAQQVGSTLQPPQPLLDLNRPKIPAWALLATESNTSAAVRVIAFI